MSRDFEVLGACLSKDEGGRFKPVDLRRPEALEVLFKRFKPQAVVHAAAMADPAECEKRPEEARFLNEMAPTLLAALCRDGGARLIHFSTDLVFGGSKSFYTEDDVPDPSLCYGRLKAEAERNILEILPGAAVLRVSLVYGWARGGRPSFADWLWERMSAGQKVRLYHDQWRTPTRTASLPEVVRALIIKRPELGGPLHWAGADRVNRVELGRAFCRVFGFPENLIEPCSMDQAPSEQRRPRDSSLDCRRLSGLLGMAPVPLETGLRRLKAERGP